MCIRTDKMAQCVRRPVNLAKAVFEESSPTQASLTQSERSSGLSPGKAARSASC